jgi:hypothetical protein
MPINEGHPYNAVDCNDTVYTAPLSGKVIVANCAILPNDHPGQLFYCSREGITNEFIIDKTVFAISLSTGEHHRFGRSDIIGTLKPELLHDEAKLHLSQIRPDGAPESENPEYCGYCFLGNGLYSNGVWLRDPEEAVEFAEMQAPYQHRVMICDRDDISVMDMKNGEPIHISRAVWDAYLQRNEKPEQTGGMIMT